MASRSCAWGSPNQDTDTGEVTADAVSVCRLSQTGAATLGDAGGVPGDSSFAVAPHRVPAAPEGKIPNTRVASVSALGVESQSPENLKLTQCANDKTEQVQSLPEMDGSVWRKSDPPFSDHAGGTCLPSENCQESPSSPSRSVEAPDFPETHSAWSCMKPLLREMTETCAWHVGNRDRGGSSASDEIETSGGARTSAESAVVTGDCSSAGVSKADPDEDSEVPSNTERLAAGGDEKTGCLLGQQLTARLQELVEATRCPCPPALARLRLDLHDQLQQLRSEVDNQVRCLESQLHGVKAVLDHLQMRQLRMEMVPGSGFTSDVDSLTSSGDDDTEESSTCTSSTDPMTSHTDARGTRNGETGEIHHEALPGQPDHCMWIRQHLVTLLTDLDLGSSLLLPSLVGEGVLSETDEEDICSHRTRKDQARELLLKLRRCPRDKFDVFRRCLETDFPHLARLPLHNTETGENEAGQSCVTCDVTRRVAVTDVMDALFSAGALSPRGYQQLWRGASARLEWRHLQEDMNARDPRLGVQVLVRALEKKHPDLSRRLLRSGLETFACLCPPRPRPGAARPPTPTSAVRNACALQKARGLKSCKPPTAAGAAAFPKKSENVRCRVGTGKVSVAESRARPAGVCMATGESLPTILIQTDPYGEMERRPLDDEGSGGERRCTGAEMPRQEERDVSSEPVTQTTASKPGLVRRKKKGPRFQVIIRPSDRNLHYTLQYRLCRSWCPQQ